MICNPFALLQHSVVVIACGLSLPCKMALASRGRSGIHWGWYRQGAARALLGQALTRLRGSLMSCW